MPPSPVAKEPPLHVVLVGDSTMSTYGPMSPVRGWGEFVQGRFGAKVVVTNLAVGGASTRSFLDSPRWPRALALHPRYVLIQFGHNDSVSPDHLQPSDAIIEYPANLCRFVREARAVGASPILISPVERRQYDADGTLRLALADYAAATKQVAEELHVPFVDLHALSCRLYQDLGPARTPSLAPTQTDRTHFNERGPRALANLVVKQLTIEIPPLKSALK